MKILKVNLKPGITESEILNLMLAIKKFSNVTFVEEESQTSNFEADRDKQEEYLENYFKI